MRALNKKGGQSRLMRKFNAVVYNVIIVLIVDGCVCQVLV